MCQLGASDLHLCVGSPALVRKDGRIQALDPNMPALSDEYLQRLLDPIMPPPNRQEFAERHDTDFARSGPGRFRANVFADRKGRGRRLPRHPVRRSCRRRSRPVVAHPQPAS
jgi:twitching motility protein PilT